MTDLRTDFQKACDKRAEKVCKMFTKLKSDSNGSLNAILNYISKTLTDEGNNITPMGVKGILIRKGLYETNSSRVEGKEQK